MSSIRQLMKQAQQMQEQLKRELGEMEVQASVGGGMVTITMTGHKQVRSVKIDPEVIDPEDPTLLEDLMKAAFNQAVRDVDEKLQGRVGTLAAGMPGLF